MVISLTFISCFLPISIINLIIITMTSHHYISIINEKHIIESSHHRITITLSTANHCRRGLACWVAFCLTFQTHSQPKHRQQRQLAK